MKDLGKNPEGEVWRMVVGACSRRYPFGHDMRWRRGFTLIELLIVVSIISILAAIAVPNFLEAQTRAKVARVKNDMRSMATALESYRVDTNRYMQRSKVPGGGSLLGLADVNRRQIEIAGGVDGTQIRGGLTTPIAYISTLPVDVFENRVAAPNRVLDYYSPILVEHMRDSRFGFPQFDYTRELLAGGNEVYTFGWMLLSVGPDAQLGNSANQANYPIVSSFASWVVEYDPTNGTISPGNITRFMNGRDATAAFFVRP